MCLPATLSHTSCLSLQFTVESIVLRCHLASISVQSVWKPEMIWKETKLLSCKTLPEAGKTFPFLWGASERSEPLRASFVPCSLLLTLTTQDTSAKSFTCTYVSGNIPDKKELLLKSCGFNHEGFKFFFAWRLLIHLLLYKNVSEGLSFPLRCMALALELLPSLQNESVV